MAHPKPDFTIKWGTLDEPIAPIADIDQNNGWSFLGNTPPTAAQFDYMMALYDKRDAWLEEQVTATPTETVAAPIEIATQAETDAGTDDQRAVTPKKLRFGVSFSIGKDGYIKLPSWLGGLIIQWGEVLSHTSGTAVSFTTAFSNQCFSVFCQDHAVSQATSVPIGVNSSPTTTDFIAYHSNTDGPNFWFFAIGN